MKYKRQVALGILVTVLMTASWMIINVDPAGKNNQLPEQHPFRKGEVQFCHEGLNGNDCIKCSCETSEDCKLVKNPYVISQCAEEIVVNLESTESCINKVAEQQIEANCIIPEDYQSPEFEIICQNNTCAQIIK